MQSSNGKQQEKVQSYITREKLRSRNLFAYCSVLGYKAQLQTKQNQWFTGLVNCIHQEGIVLQQVTNQNQTQPVDYLSFLKKDIVQLVVENVNPPPMQKELSIESENNKSQMNKQRQLQKWTPQENGNTDLSLEQYSHSMGQWDQFQENEKKFGVKTSWNEELYTTKAVSKSELTEQQIEQAERIAAEIEGCGHKDEREDLDDEEAMFSAVQGTGAYSNIAKKPPLSCVKSPKNKNDKNNKKQRIRQQHQQLTHLQSQEKQEKTNSKQQKDLKIKQLKSNENKEQNSPMEIKKATSLQDFQENSENEQMRSPGKVSRTNSREDLEERAKLWSQDRQQLREEIQSGKTPKSQLIHDHQQISAMNLEVAKAKVPVDALNKFLQFREQNSPQRKKSTKEMEIQELKQQGQIIERKLSSSRKNSQELYQIVKSKQAFTISANNIDQEKFINNQELSQVKQESFIFQICTK